MREMHPLDEMSIKENLTIAFLLIAYT